MAMHDMSLRRREKTQTAGLDAESSSTTDEAIIDDTALVDPRSLIGERTRIWGLSQVRESAVVGADCTIGRGVYIDHGVEVGAGSKVQNGAQLFAPARVGDGVFIGPSAVLTNDLVPRAVTPDGATKAADGWTADGVDIGRGASIGAGAVVLAGVRIGPWAMVGAGAVVVDPVPAHALVVGVPARQVGWVSESGHRLREVDGDFVDDHTNLRYRLASTGLEVAE